MRKDNVASLGLDGYIFDIMPFTATSDIFYKYHCGQLLQLFFLLCYNNCLFLKEMSDYKFCTNFKGNGIHICFDLAFFSSCSYTVFLFFLPCLERDPSFHYFINLKRVTSYHFPYLNGEFTWPYMETLLLSSVKAILCFWNAKLNFYLSPILLPCLWSVFLKWGK